jgi:hypothetical protein
LLSAISENSGTLENSGGGLLRAFRKEWEAHSYAGLSGPLPFCVDLIYIGVKSTKKEKILLKRLVGVK